MDVELVRVRVLAYPHPKFNEVGTVPLREFERAARLGSRGEFVVEFDSGVAAVEFGQVELELDSPAWQQPAA